MTQQYGPLTPQDVEQANQRGSDLIVYEGYAVSIPHDQIVAAAHDLAVMGRGHRKRTMKRIDQSLTAFIAKYPAAETDPSSIPDQELADFKADVGLHFAEVFRRGEHEQHRMPDWMMRKN